MKRILLFILFAVFLSCNKREVRLAETTNAEILEPTDVSPIYLFYDEEGDSAQFNRRNMIGTTNWLVNVDKRNSLGDLLPHLQYLQQKRRGDGMHKNPEARNYFSCSNPEIQNLAFIDFTEVTYHNQPIQAFVREVDIPDTIIPLYINVRDRDTVQLGRLFTVSTFKLSELLERLNQVANSDSLTNRIYMNYKSNLSFQDYIDFKTELLKLKHARLQIAMDEFIYK